MVQVEVVARGDVGRRAREDARTKVAAVERYVKGPILHARVVLTRERNPRVPDPARAEAEVDLQGRTVRARAAAASMEAAVDDVAERLARHLQRHVDGIVTAQRRPREWTRRAWSPPHRPALERHGEPREIVRRKSFAFGPMPVDEAADALEDLDHEFFLFVDADSGADALLYWRDDGRLALLDPRPAMTVGAAVAEMDGAAHRYRFFENERTGRANVIYRRYDGQYGLIEPAPD